MKHPILGLLLAAAPALVQAAPLDTALACGQTPGQFFAMLRSQHLIDPEPMHVEPDSVNAFWPARDATLSAFDLSVFAVFAYEAGNPAFRAGKGTPHGKPVYGAVVVARMDTVRKALQAAGSKAGVEHAAPFMTAIVCEGP